MQVDLFNNNEPTTGKEFYNTIHAEGAELNKYRNDARSQEKIILKIFEPGEKLTALEVARRTKLNHDSTKRAITGLKNKGKIIKLSEMVIEEFGKKNHYWIINK